MELAEHLFKKFSEKEKVDCLELTFELAHQTISGYGLHEPYCLVLDNDVINALEKPNIYKVRYVALISFFRGIKNLPVNYRILINPVIFYEFNNEKAFHSERFFQDGWDLINRAISQVGLPIYSLGLDSFKQAKSNFKSFKHDVKIIKSALEKINKTCWQVNLKSDFGTILPQYIASKRCPKIKMKYFSLHHARLFLMNLIENKIINHKDNYAKARKFRYPDMITKAKLLKIKKGKVKGLGDLALLSLCDIGSQFHHENKQTFIGITFDKTLAEVLQNHSRIIVSGEPIIGGEDNSETILSKIKNNFKLGAEFNKMTKNSNKFFIDIIECIREVEWFKKEMKKSSS